MKKLLVTFTFLFISMDIWAQAIDTFVLVGRHKLHFKIMKGIGVPILFEAGNGDDGSVWQDILKPLHDSIGATLVTYDRAGLGRSEIDTIQIGIDNEVKALEVALQKLGYNNGIFIVSHSFGSYYSTLYAHRHRNRVKGAVFIDVLTPCYFTMQRARETKGSISNEDWGILKKEAIGLYYVLQQLPEIYIYTKDKQMPSIIPLTIIGADNPPRIVKEQEIDEWKNCLRSFGEMPNHQYVLAKNCGHKVWKDNPSIVVAEIINLYMRVAK